MDLRSSLNLVEASIADLQSALETGSVTSVELVAKYLLRISTYDCRGPCLNAIPILNPSVFDEAAQSDARRAAGTLLSPLDGIVYTLKDSMKYKGMTCAAGSPAFEHLTAPDDSFVAAQLRAAGCVCIGRTNTPPMMASGMHRGVYGRAESPYNLDYLTAAFSSGSSNGSATATAASFASFGLGSETVSSGRSPASNNGLIAYTPSRTVISPRGCWPLYPTCDVIVPHTRTMSDMLAILPFLTQRDTTDDEDFWRQQAFVKITSVPTPRYAELEHEADHVFSSRRVAVPRIYIGGHDPRAQPNFVSPEVVTLWLEARKALESLGADVVETDFPLVTNYEDDSESGHTNNVLGFKPSWSRKERGELVSYTWDDFLKTFGHPGLAHVDGAKIFPRPTGYIPDRYLEHKNFMDYPGLVEVARTRGNTSVWDLDGLAEALPALENQRRRDLERWMDQNKIDVVVFPANGDVGKSDVDTNDTSARHALRNGVKYSNGNRAIRHMGVPTVSATMGRLPTSGMPINLTFAGRHAQDAELLQMASAFATKTKHRFPPPLTPPLVTDHIPLTGAQSFSEFDPPTIHGVSVEKMENPGRIRICGSSKSGSQGEEIDMEVFVDGKAGQPLKADSLGNWSIETEWKQFTPVEPLYGGVGQVVKKIMIIILARASNTRWVTGRLELVDQD